MERFPEKLKHARRKTDLSQVQLAERVGVSSKTISDYETGRAIPRKATLRKLSEVLQVTIEYLTNDAVDDPESGRLQENRLNYAYELLGSKGEKELADLLARNTALLAGGNIDQEAKDIFFDAIMTAYVTCRKEARERFIPKSKQTKGNTND